MMIAASVHCFMAQDYPTPEMKALGMLCGGGWPWLDPCREEFRRT